MFDFVLLKAIKYLNLLKLYVKTKVLIYELCKIVTNEISEGIGKYIVVTIL